MAKVVVKGNELVVRLRLIEKAGALHGDVRVPLSSVSGVRVVDNPWCERQGIRAPATGVPALIALGTWRGDFGRDFVAIYGRGPGVVIDLRSAEYRRLVISTRNAPAVAAHVPIELDPMV